VQLVGPSLAYRPASNNTWWTEYLQFIGQNSSVPDQYTYHVEGEPDDPTNDPEQSSEDLKTLLAEYGLPVNQININEYGAKPEQQPAGAAWFISRLERNDIIGLRGNWASGFQLHDYLANLLAKPGAGTSSYNMNGTGYWPNGEWQVYKYYVNMTASPPRPAMEARESRSSAARVSWSACIRLRSKTLVPWDCQLPDLSTSTHIVSTTQAASTAMSRRRLTWACRATRIVGIR
jgi:hypothetical protein